MRLHPATAFVALLLAAAACSNSEATDTTAGTTTTTSSTTTTTLVATTDPSTTTSVVTTTTTAPEETTTTTSAEVTTTTTMPPAEPDPDLVPWAGLFRQPTAFNGFLDFQSNGVIRAGTSVEALNIIGRWDYDETAEEFVFTDFDFGAGCGGAEGRYARESASGGGRRILMVEDPCQDRVDFITQPGSTCHCFLYNRVEIPEVDEG